MREKLLEYLLCPQCSGELRLRPEVEVNGEIKEGNLICRLCGQSFPIINSIPRFVPESHLQLFRQTWRNFGFSWRRFARIYADPRDFLDWIKPVSSDFFQGRSVLDAGCGTGLQARFAALFGAKEVVAFDLSPAVEVAYENTHDLPQVHIIQADIYHLPLKSKFDYVYSIGVLQHLPEPEMAFLNLVKLLNEGGYLSIWVYGYEGTGPVRWVVDPIRRLTSRMPLSLVYLASFLPAATVFLLTRLMSWVEARSKHPFGKSFVRTLPLGAYLAYMAQFDFTYIHNSVFDQLIAPITRYFRQAEVEAWFKKAGLEEVQISSRNEMSWRGFGRKVSPPS
jgi:SAM-dependent methyltransferase